MKAIIFATREEAVPFLDAYERGRFSALAEGEILQDDRVLVSIVGIGKIKAALRTERLLRQHRASAVLHAGTCTALTADVPVGGVFAVEQVFEGDRIELAAPTYPRMPLTPPVSDAARGTLVTQDHPVNGDQEITYWQRIADVTDMTGYAVAYVAATHGVPCQILKVVTGRVGVDDPALRKTLDRAYATLGNALLKIVAP